MGVAQIEFHGGPCDGDIWYSASSDPVAKYHFDLWFDGEALDISLNPGGPVHLYCREGPLDEPDSMIPYGIRVYYQGTKPGRA
jgi:hypothetical protein